MKHFFRNNRSRQTGSPNPMPSLVLCIAMDLLGCASYLVPILGEAIDVVWAPISAAVYFRLFGGLKGVLGGAFSFVEELLPGMDIIPTFTLSWLVVYYQRKKRGTTSLRPIHL